MKARRNESSSILSRDSDVRRAAGAACAFRHLPEQWLSGDADPVQAAPRGDLEDGVLITVYAPDGDPLQAAASLKDLGTAIDTLNKRRGPS